MRLLVVSLGVCATHRGMVDEARTSLMTGTSIVQRTGRFAALTERRTPRPPAASFRWCVQSGLRCLGNFRRADPSERKPVGVICPGETAKAVKGELQTLSRTSLPSDRTGLKRIDDRRRFARIGPFDADSHSEMSTSIWFRSASIVITSPLCASAIGHLPAPPALGWILCQTARRSARASTIASVS